MDLDPSRLRRGELIAGASAALLLVFALFLPWYGVGGVAGALASKLGVSTTIDGWHGLQHLRWLMLLTILAALSLLYLQATRRAPALPVAMSVIVCVLGVLISLALVYRVLINAPGADNLLHPKVGAFFGLLSALGIAYGGYASMRKEGLSAKDARAEIEMVRAGSAGGS